MSEEMKQGMTRREVLKKGALFGGTLMWVAPVVQAVGMSPAMAKIPSETSCCLNFLSLTAVWTGTEVELTAEFLNCSTHKKNLDVKGDLYRLEWVGSQPVEASATRIPDEGYAFNQGGIQPAETRPDGYTDLVTPYPGTGDYIYRSHATYDCYEDDTLKAAGLDHNIPSGFWVYSNVVSLP